ncbi:MAG TPA: penicillin-binding transpeptidase domain-containing protein [Acidimicrobiales bacterium]
MNKQIRQLGIALVVCYVALFGMLNQIQLFGAEALNERPENTDVIRIDYARNRGSISTADGTVIAESVPVNDEFDFQRRYPTGDLFAAATGFYSFEFGATGLERSYQDELVGDTAEQQLRGFADLFVGEDQVGDLRTSLRTDLQQQAKDMLGQRRGAVVAIDPRTGEILALWDYPSYDPNLLAGHDFAVVREQRAFLQPDDPNSPLVATSYQDRYFPGSTFKVVVGSSGLKFGVVSPESPSYPVESSWVPPQTTRPMNNSHTCGGTLFVILAESCNTSFARMAVETLHADRTIAGAEAFGFNREPPIDLPGAVASNFPTDFTDNAPALAQSAIGQFEVAASPLQMALIAATIANDGVTMAPHVVTQLRDGDGDVVETYDPEVWLQPISAGDAATMQEAMRGVLGGTATNLAGLPGLDVGAKTGTAQLGTDPPSSHAWMIAWAGPEGSEPEIAVAVLVEGTPGVGSEATGNSEAGPIARCIIATALEVDGGSGCP